MKFTGSTLKQARRAAGFTLHQLAQRAGTSTRTLSEIEAGRHRPGRHLHDRFKVIFSPQSKTDPRPWLRVSEIVRRLNAAGRTCNKKTIARRAARESWPKRHDLNRHEFLPPASLLAEMAGANSLPLASGPKAVAQPSGTLAGQILPPCLSALTCDVPADLLMLDEVQARLNLSDADFQLLLAAKVFVPVNVAPLRHQRPIPRILRADYDAFLAALAEQREPRRKATR